MRAFRILIIGVCLPAFGATPTDTPADYAYRLPLTAGAGVAQLRLPDAVYLHAQSAQLDDLRLFDASGAPLPFALHTPPAQTRTSHRRVDVKIFPLMGKAAAPDKLDLDVHTAADGRVLSVRMRGDQAGGSSLASLVLDLRQGAQAEPPLVDALHFTLPPGAATYSAQLWLETSNDLKVWEMVGATDLNWLVNGEQTLANDRLEFAPRAFRYARLSWRAGTPIQFASIQADSPERSELAATSAQLVLQPAPGKFAQDLVYVAPPAVTAQAVGLQFEETNVVLPAMLGTYRELPAHQIGKASSWRFDPLTRATFYRITQGGQARSSGELLVTPTHASQWVLRPLAPTSARPALHLQWTPATLVFLANGKGPYSLVFGRAGAHGAVRALDQVAPGFSDAELLAVASASAAPLEQQHAGAAAGDAVADAASAARHRQWALWAVLIAGVGILGMMVRRLLIRTP
ncbi:MAG: DUF3999 family protein [Pseudomonadota bacterium]